MADWPVINEAYMWAGGGGIVGRLMYHAKAVQQGKRKPLSWALMVDPLIALGMGWAILGICIALGMQREPTISAAIIFGYLGPWSIDQLFARMADKYLGKGPAQ